MSEATELNKTTKSDIYKIDPHRIRVDHQKNPRKDYGDLHSLIEYIKVNGTEALPPIKVKKSKDEDGNEVYDLIHGYRRMTAIAKLLEKGVEIARVKCIAVQVGYTEQDELLDHVSENSGMKLNPLEEAEVYQSLINFGWTQAEVAKKIGKTQSHVSQLLRLTNVSDFVKETISEGKIAASLVMQLVNDHKDDEKKVESIIRSSLNRLEETGSTKKVTAKTLTVQRVSKYRKLYEQAVASLREKETTTAKLTAIKTKIEPIIKMLEDAENSDELAEKLLTLV